jgi:hypothetical protein
MIAGKPDILTVMQHEGVSTSGSGAASWLASVRCITKRHPHSKLTLSGNAGIASAAMRAATFPGG